MSSEGPKELAVAARNGDVRELARLLARGIDVNALVEFGGTALIQAAAAGQAEAAIALLDAKADIEAVTAVRTQRGVARYGRGNSGSLLRRASARTVARRSPNECPTLQPFSKERRENTRLCMWPPRRDTRM
jgi:ankyrin repeat protein